MGPLLTLITVSAVKCFVNLTSWSLLKQILLFNTGNGVVLDCALILCLHEAWLVNFSAYKWKFSHQM